MSKSLSSAIATISLIGLSACGSSSEAPAEQIVVKGQGQGDASAAPVTGEDLVAKGKSAFAACMACHSVIKDGPSGAGPNLYGVVGRKAGTLVGFSYSNVMQDSGIEWSKSELDSFITNPSAKVKGTRMVAGAVPDEERRKAIIAYLASLSK